MGYWGKVLLAIIVFFACLTTAVGLTSVAAEYYEEVSKGRLSYKVLVVAICAISTVISTVGVSNIIKVAGPLLDIIYQCSNINSINTNEQQNKKQCSL